MVKNLTIKTGSQITLGVIWLIDGALQLQPQMFTSKFATQVIAPAADGQPTFVSGVMHFFISIFLVNPAVFNSLIALTQLALGALILYKPTRRYGLVASIAWGLFVWYVGEGLGDIFSGHTLLLMGAPGAALLYSILAFAVMPKKNEKTDDSTGQPAYWLALVWLFLWVGGAIYQLLPGQNSISAVSSMVLSTTSQAPGWLVTIGSHAASTINGFGSSTVSMTGIHMSASQMAQMPVQSGSGYWFIVTLALVQAAIGLGVLFSRNIRRFFLIAGIIVSVVFWVIGQSLGGYYTGLATDPNAGPLFILLAVAILGCVNLDKTISKFFKNFEKKIA